jgi:hypothetical protein
LHREVTNTKIVLLQLWGCGQGATIVQGQGESRRPLKISNARLN